MIKRFFIVLFLVLVLTAGALSCGGNNNETTSTSTTTTTTTAANGETLTTSTTDITNPATTQPLTAQEIVGKLMGIYPELTTFKTDAKMNVSMDMVVDGLSNAVTMEMTMNSSMNVTDKEMVMNMIINMDTPEIGMQEMPVDILMTGNWTYYGIKLTDDVEQWVKIPIGDETEQFWDQQDQLTIQLGLLQSFVDASLQGNEMINGTDCYVLQIEPDTTSLFDWIAGQMQQAGGAFGDTLPEYNFDSFSVKIWVAKDTYYPVKESIDVSVNMSIEDPDSGTVQDMNMDMGLTAGFSDYGVPFTVEVPQEALDAPEVSPDILSGEAS